MFDTIINFLHDTLFSLSPFAILVLEWIGLAIIILGVIRAVSRLIKVKFDFADIKYKTILLESFSSALEFKLGAEIVNTIIVENYQDLVLVGLITILRIMISLLIHWEMKQMTSDHQSPALDMNEN